MDSSTRYVKAYLCECGCAWSIDKFNPEICWFCGAIGPHEVKITSPVTPKILSISSKLAEEELFSNIEEVRR